MKNFKLSAFALSFFLSTFTAVAGENKVQLTMDRRILEAVARHGGGPVGIKTIAVSVDETEDTVENVYEPYLIQQGYLTKTPRGRVLTEAAYRVLGEAPPAGGQQRIF